MMFHDIKYIEDFIEWLEARGYKPHDTITLNAECQAKLEEVRDKHRPTPLPIEQVFRGYKQ